MEIGAGDCSLAIQIASICKKVIALDVSNEISKNINFPENCTFVISDGLSIPVEPASVDLAYSYQLAEHFHEDDFPTHLKNVLISLKPQGKYLIVTPHRFSGPHDVSKFYSKVPQGFHLKEYSYGEINVISKKMGFKKNSALIGVKGNYLKVPINCISFLESLFELITPSKYRFKVAMTWPFRMIFESVNVLVEKR